MVIDPSALLAILFSEADSERFLLQLVSNTPRLMSCASYVELFVVAHRRLEQSRMADIEALLEEFSVEVMPFDAEQALLAREAHLRFGKGRHPAALNFGDCFSYALAKLLNEPLLFKGGDFSQTDVLVASAA